MKARRRLLKYVKEFECIFCDRNFPLDDTTFRTLNAHGWGCCKDCWELEIPHHNVYFSSERTREMIQMRKEYLELEAVNLKP